MSSRKRNALAGLAAVAATVLAIAIHATATADFSLRDWRYVKAIALPSSLGGGGLVELVPDPDVFAGSAAGLADLRVVRDDGTEAPYKIEVGQAQRQRAPLPAAVRDIGHLAGQHTSFIADLGRTGLLHNEIAFATPSTNFRRKAVVESSNDSAAWARLTDQQVYDFTVKERSFTARDTRVRYPDSTARYLRVTISDDGEGPIQVTGATVVYVKETSAIEAPWPATVLGVGRDDRRRATTVEVDLGAPGLPSYRLAANVPDINFNRDVTIEASGDRSKWRGIQERAAIYAYDTPKFTGKSLAVTYPEATARYLRLVIHDEDSPPLRVQGVEVWGLRRGLVFAAEPGRSYNLYYGNPDARRPSYDIERVFPYLVTEGLPQAQLGGALPNSAFVEKKPPQPPVSERLPWLFPTVVTLAALVVALLLFAVIRQARKVLPPPPE